ncbi:Hint domain-containing protein, partial [Labrys portucalensis]
MPTDYGPNIGGVTYTVGDPAPITGFRNVDISGGALDGTVLSNVPSGNIAQTDGTTLTLLNAIGTTNYVVPPTVNANVVLVANVLGVTQVYIGGTATISTAVSVLGNTNLNITGGSATLANGLNVSALTGTNIGLSDGGSFSNGNNLSSILDGMGIYYGPGGGTFTVNGGGTLIDLSSTTIHHFATNNGLNHLAFENTSAAPASYSVTGPAGGPQTITVRDAGGNIIATANLADSSLTAGTYTPGDPGPLTVGTSGNTLTITDQAVVCFLAGTLIRTASGEVAIEKIQVGDEVFVSMDG